MVMTDTIPVERNRQSPIPGNPIAAYALGYADGRRLVNGHGGESLRPMRERFLAHVEAKHPTPAEQAYVAGVRDAAADNLPSPPQEPYDSPYQRAA
jgi:hypothetical protein